MAPTTFTIGIPTRNRATFLERAIECAVGQTYPHVEIVVSDNASDDETPEVVRRFGERVRYSRNDTNAGPWNNFRRVTELATGDIFAWLQDDCLLHREFAERAVGALSRWPEAAAYGSYLAAASTVGSAEQMLFHPRIYGPPFPANWMGGSPRVVDGRLLPVLGMFANPVPSPTLALRLDAARRGIAAILPDCLIYNERIVLAEAVGNAPLVVDPWIGGVYQMHPAQVTSSLPLERWHADWEAMARHVGDRLGGRPEGEWRIPFEEFLAGLAEADRRLLADNPDKHTPPDDRWGAVHPVAGRIHDALWRSLSPASRSALARPGRSAFRRIVRALVPPICLHVGERAWRWSSRG